jgi:NADPH:quinone reductase-like Zn-dependent oxidoreductase
MLAELAKLIEQGAIRPVTDSTYALQDAAAAYEHLADGHAVGKIVIFPID